MKYNESNDRSLKGWCGLTWTLCWTLCESFTHATCQSPDRDTATNVTWEPDLLLLDSSAPTDELWDLGKTSLLCASVSSAVKWGPGQSQHLPEALC